MPRRTLAVAFVLLATGSAHAQWTTDLSAALAQARDEHKLILADVRGGPDPAKDAFIVVGEKQVPLAKAYGSFVRVRIDGQAEVKPPEVVRLLQQGVPVPSFAVIDPSGTFVTWWMWTDNLSTHFNFLNRARQETSAILDAAAVRAKGSEGDADVMLANVNLRLYQFGRARDLYGIAANTFLMQPNRDKAERAAIGEQLATYMWGRREESVHELRRMASRKDEPQIAAAALIALGKAYLFTEDIGPAAAAFHDALGTAADGSPEWRTARDQLLQLGDRGVMPASTTDAPIAIRVPRGTSLTGNAIFSANAEPGIVRMEWFLDGRPARSTVRPFDASIDLGPTPRLHAIDAVGYAADGTPVARASTSVNDRLDELRVHLLTPVSNRVKGPVRIEADAYVPPGHSLEVMDFSWNDQPIGTVTKRPYRVEFDVPDVFGYLRVSGRLDDGRTAEDVHIVNASGFNDVMDVHKIAFAATVLDREGQRVNGLRQTDFRAVDGRQPVALEVKDSPEDPATIGLAVDLSASMTPLLLPVIDLASRFVRSGSDNDKVLLITFAERPHLAQPLTGDRSLLLSKIQNFTAFGNTALVDALAFSMQQFTGVTGKRGLILITDGNEGESQQRASACLQMARESGVPIYVIIPQEAQDTDAGPPFRRLLREMANVSGGMMVVRPKRDELEAVVKHIRDEIRGQYLLSFSAQSDQPGTWRSLRVSVPAKAATVRTIAGSYVR